ncbi:MAG TPA: hypothetical protein VHR45_01385 [Thermoanaerobaculia bacterium]|nr:hypothetical protein [Thermoanaerobaculia bacterium]
MRRGSRAPSTVVDIATAADEPELRRLLRDHPLAGEIRVTLEREPDTALAAAVEGEPHATIVARRRDGSLCGMGSRTVTDAFVNGRPSRLGYLSQLRLDWEERRRAGLLRLLAGGYEKLRGLRAAGEAPFDLTSVVADNRAARRLLGAGLPGLPAYVELEPFVTLVLSPPRRGRTWRPEALPAGVTAVRGAPEIMAKVAACLERSRRRYQFAPRFTTAQLVSPVRSRGLAPRDFHLAVRGGQVIGCLALWDQSGFKQVVVRGYGRRLTLLRPALNRLSPLIGRPRLPAAGELLPHAYVSHVAVDGDDPRIFAALLASAYREAAGRFLYLVAGFAERHPFLASLRRRARQYRSVLYAVCWEKEGKAAVAALDGRIPHLEVALL